MPVQKQMDFITQRMKLKDAYPDFGQAFPDVSLDKLEKKYGLKEENLQFVRKGLTASDLRFDEDERAVISTITTNAKDRDNEIVDPAGAILDDYNKNKVVLFGHDHHSLPIGKNAWIKTNKKGLVAKTIYANHEKADEIYQYRKDGFPLAQSIGFIPLEWINYEDGDKSPEAKNGVRRKYTKWMLLEYSDVPVPSNPEAVAIAVSKALITEDDIEDYNVDKDEIILLLEDEKNNEKADINVTSFNFEADNKFANGYMGNKIFYTDSNGNEIEYDGSIFDGMTSEEIKRTIKIAEKLNIITKPGWDETETSFRYRVRNPDLFQEDSMKTVPIKRDSPKVNAVMGRLKDEDTMTKQSLIFPKNEDWTLAKAKKWLKEHDELLKFLDEYINIMYKHWFEGWESEELDKNTINVEEKAGRTLSAKTRKTMSAAVTAMSSATVALNQLMDESDSKPDEEDSKTQLGGNGDDYILEIEEKVEPDKDSIEVNPADIDAIVKDKVATMFKDTLATTIKDVVMTMKGRV